jgi:5-methyltetrahydropteroyltriglutamate--homocysteine methyltransferase
MTMKISTNRILTTHTGSLPRPADLVELIKQNEVGQINDRAAYEARIASAVDEIVRHQAEVGIDIVNDGEAGKPGYSTYVKDRLTGFGGESRTTNINAEARDFPEWGVRRVVGSAAIQRPACDGPVAWQDFGAVEREIANLKAAAARTPTEEVFMSAASPGVIAAFLPNEHYASYEEYIQVLADVMRREYNAVYQAGFILQLDCPDLAMTRHNRHVDKSLDEFRAICNVHVDAINEATKDIPPEAMRIHLCWGNYEGPHHLDMPIKDIIDIVLRSRPAAISFEGANPRHEHEWQLWETMKLPEGRYLVPGVIDSTSNFIEHPELVAQRIQRYAGAVGRENVIAGSDCGFGTFATSDTVDPRISWAKLGALAEGAAIASKALWK